MAAVELGEGCSRSSHMFDTSTMGERLSLEAEQEQRLLVGGSDSQEAEDEKESKVEWHLRTIWVLAASLLTTALVFGLMVLFARYYIVEAVEPELNTGEVWSGDFRRPSNDYLLDRNWNFNAGRTVREYNWTIVDRVANPDGVYRPMITVNGQFPGPMIECNEGDSLIINVDNQSVNATSIHFHGIFQNGTNFQDGTVGITNCPIAPNGRYQYKFNVEGQSGTYFYHAHQAVQIADGLFGPLVIHSKKEKQLQGIAYDTDRVVMLQGYYHDPSSSTLRSSLEPGSETDPIPDGALINGLNSRDCALSPSRLCDNATARLAAINLASNANHRLRFINVGASAWFEVSVDEHSLAVSEVDGTDVVPSYATELHISPAQRYSAIITTNQTTATSYWLRARMITNCFSDPDMPAGGADEVRAVVQYSDGNLVPASIPFIAQPTTHASNTRFAVEYRDMDTTGFVPVPAISAPATVDHSYFFRLNMKIGDWRLQRGFFNESSFRPDLRSPSLHRIIEGLQSDNESFISSANGINNAAFEATKELIIQHQGIKVVDLVIQNFDERSHPLHLHGHKFWVLAQNHGYFSGYENIRLNISNPLRRDTVTVEGFGWILLRFVTDNPGIWAFHCHNAWHAEAGMVMQFLSQPDAMRSWELPEANLRLCEANGLEKGAAPKDETWFGFGVG
jgi:FtsP/CotA-like multicopper oxidase with cupredoxin domain